MNVTTLIGEKDCAKEGGFYKLEIAFPFICITQLH